MISRFLPKFLLCIVLFTHFIYPNSLLIFQGKKKGTHFWAPCLCTSSISLHSWCCHFAIKVKTFFKIRYYLFKHIKYLLIQIQASLFSQLVTLLYLDFLSNSCQNIFKTIHILLYIIDIMYKSINNSHFVNLM